MYRNVDDRHTQVSLEVWVDVHVFAPLHHTLEDGNQTLQALFT